MFQASAAAEKFRDCSSVRKTDKPIKSRGWRTLADHVQERVGYKRKLEIWSKLVLSRLLFEKMTTEKQVEAFNNDLHAICVRYLNEFDISVEDMVEALEGQSFALMLAAFEVIRKELDEKK